MDIGQIWECICIGVIVFLIYYLFNSKMQPRHASNGIALAGAAIIIVANIALYILTGTYDALPYINTLLYLLYSYFIFDGSLTKRILWACAASMIVTIADITAIALANIMYFDNIAGIVTSSYTRFYLSAIYIFIAAALIIVIIRIGTRDRKAEYRLNLPQNISLIAVTIICAVVADIFKVKFFSASTLYTPQASIDAGNIATIAYAGILGAFLLFIFGYAKSKQREYESRIEIDMLISENAHYKQNEESVKSLRELRHDISTHMHVMKTLVDQGKSDELLEYFNSVDRKYKKDNSLFLTNNSMLNAMLTSKANSARKDDIIINLKYNTKREIPLPYLEFSSLFGNLLDNAIESNQKLPCEVERYIDITIGDKGEMVFIRVENASDGNYRFDDGILQTTKRDSKHGIGLKRVKSIAESIGGFFDVNPLPDKFTAFVMLPPIRKDEKHD